VNKGKFYGSLYKLDAEGELSLCLTLHSNMKFFDTMMQCGYNVAMTRGNLFDGVALALYCQISWRSLK
jgi:hypothetical protein